MKIKHFAFTLAEVLITLGIIGVVAAMTMPALIEYHQKSVISSRLKKFYSSINQAIKLSEVDNGSSEYWDYPENDNVPELKEFYDKYLGKYLKVLEVSDKVVSTSDTSEKLPEGTILVYFSDGAAMKMRYINGVDITYYPDSKKVTEESKLNRTRFAFCFNKPGAACVSTVEPYSFRWDGTRDGLKNHASYGCRKNAPNYMFCAKLLQYDNWEFKSDYPW